MGIKTCGTWAGKIGNFLRSIGASETRKKLLIKNGNFLTNLPIKGNILFRQTD
jgi:hypothetical protein